jgi:hypothetical protein
MQAEERWGPGVGLVERGGCGSPSTPLALQGGGGNPFGDMGKLMESVSGPESWPERACQAQGVMALDIARASPPQSMLPGEEGTVDGANRDCTRAGRACGHRV